MKVPIYSFLTILYITYQTRWQSKGKKIIKIFILEFFLFSTACLCVCCGCKVSSSIRNLFRFAISFPLFFKNAILDGKMRAIRLNIVIEQYTLCAWWVLYRWGDETPIWTAPRLQQSKSFLLSEWWKKKICIRCWFLWWQLIIFSPYWSKPILCNDGNFPFLIPLRYAKEFLIAYATLEHTAARNSWRKFLIHRKIYIFSLALFLNSRSSSWQ